MPTETAVLTLRNSTEERSDCADSPNSSAAAPDEPVTVGASAALARERGWYATLKPFLDGVVALVLLLALSPLLLVLALLVKLDSSGPALYRQVRVGRNRRRPGRGPWDGQERRRRDFGGEAFTILKFRTMVQDAERETGAVWAQGPTDPRLTSIGGLLRASHMDELPQLFNVLKGEMSMVGPRPERPELVAALAERIPGYRDRTLVRPGITGLAQVRHKYDATLDDVRRKVEYDLAYIGKQGMLTDVAIVFATAKKCWDEFNSVRPLWSASSPAPASRG